MKVDDFSNGLNLVSYYERKADAIEHWFEEDRTPLVNNIASITSLARIYMSKYLF